MANVVFFRVTLLAADAAFRITRKACAKCGARRCRQEALVHHLTDLTFLCYQRKVEFSELAFR